jgi:hypothetical protein
VTDLYPPPPGWLTPQSPAGSSLGGDPAGPRRAGSPGADGRARRPRCVARNKKDGGHGAAGLRCAQKVASGDPDYLCGWHRHWLDTGHEVETVDAWINGRKVAAKTLHPNEHVPGSEVQLLDKKGRNVVQVRTADLERFNTVEGRRDTQLAALAFVDAMVRGDIYAAPGVRLKAALWHLDHADTVKELIENQDLDDELEQIVKHLSDEADELADHQVFELLSPETRTRVLTELADQGIELLDESEAS